MVNKKRVLLILVMLVLAVFLGYNGVFKLLTDKVQALTTKEPTKEISLVTSSGELIQEKEVSYLSDSGINGDDYTFDITYYPYYGLLTANEQTLYRQIYANASNLSKTFVPSVVVSPTNVANAIEAVYNDHPELFWIDTNYSYKFTETEKCVQITLNFNILADNLEKTKEYFYSITNNIINRANTLSNNYEKEKYVHDTILSMATYQLNAPVSQSAYSALVNGKTVCAGYARAFQYIMTKLNIPTYYVVGYANEEHGWNIVKLDDGYYNVDLTWDDANSDQYAYFNKTDNDLSSNRYRVGMSRYLPACTATTYRYVNEETVNLENIEITTPIIYVVSDEELELYQNQNRETILSNEQIEDNIIQVSDDSSIDYDNEDTNINLLKEEKQISSPNIDK